MKSVVSEILEELSVLSESIDQKQIEEVIDILIETKNKNGRIFISGAGRSGCIAKAFTNRIMHLGFNCSLVGEITAPPIQAGDVFFAISGSGKTASIVNNASKSKALGATVLTITLNPEGDISKMTKVLIVLPGNTRFASVKGFTSKQPVGSTFEQLAFLTCDGIIMNLRDKLGQTNEDLVARHANLE